MTSTSADDSQADTSKLVRDSVTKFWYSEITSFSAYGQEPDIGTLEAWGHYTQVVWKGSGELGCATQYCPKGTTSPDYNSWYTVCNYKNAGMSNLSCLTHILPR